MADAPILSVVMPVHQGGAWIGETLASLVGQCDGGVELIIVDSSPTPATAEIVETFADRLPLRLVGRPDIKPWQAKTNLAVGMASAPHVSILHQDDLWLPGRVAAVRDWLARAPEAVLHLAPTRIVDARGHNVGRWRCPLPADVPLEPAFMLERLLVQNFVSVPAPVFRRDAWLACGGMDEALWYTPDWDMWAKLAGLGPVIYHDEVTTAFRVHGGSLTVSGSRNGNEFRAQMETVLDRHLPRLPAAARQRTERAARAAIATNIALARAAGGSPGGMAGAALQVLALGPAGIIRFLRDSRLSERVGARIRAKLAGAF